MSWEATRHGCFALVVPLLAGVSAGCVVVVVFALTKQLRVLPHPQGKVRDIKYDREREQVVALSTDNTLSWWTPDLQLKGSCRLEAILDPVSLATCGDVVAVGSSGSVHLLDTRIPEGGNKRSSSCSSVPNSKRSRLPFGRHGTGLPPAELPPASWEAAAAGVAPAFELTTLHLLPEAYYLRLPAQPVLLAAARTVTGMQQLQASSVAAGIDPVQAEQLLRQEAASTAVTSGRTFDAALEELVGKLLQLSPQQQRARLGELHDKQQRRQQDLMWRSEQHLRLQVLQQQQLQQQMMLIQQHNQQHQLLLTQQQQQQQLLLVQQHQQLQEGGSLPPLMVPVVPGTAPVQPLHSVVGAAPAASAGAAGMPAGGPSAGYETDDEEWSSEGGYSDEEEADPIPPGEAAWQQWQERVSALTGADMLQHPAHAAGQAGAGLFPQHTELISQVRPDLQPAHGPGMALAAAGPSTPLVLSQAFLSQHGLAPAPSQLRARVSARLAWDNDVPVSTQLQDKTRCLPSIASATLCLHPVRSMLEEIFWGGGHPICMNMHVPESVLHCPPQCLKCRHLQACKQILGSLPWPSMAASFVKSCQTIASLTHTRPPSMEKGLLLLGCLGSMPLLVWAGSGSNVSIDRNPRPIYNQLCADTAGALSQHAEQHHPGCRPRRPGLL